MSYLRYNVKSMINYPTKHLSSAGVNKSKSFSNRGMSLEDDLNTTNQSYLNDNRAVIYKKPTPVQVVKVDYPARNKAKIVEAYYKIASTTDYNGIYKGRYIDFEAKESKSKTSFVLANIHQHQIDHMRKIKEHGGIAFLIIRFTSLDETYLLYIEDYLEFVKLNKRKSLPYTWIVEKAHQINYHLLRPVDYLTVLDKTLFKGE